MTTNIGAQKIEQPLPVGFITPTDEEKDDMKVSVAIEEIKNHFRPEFVNRINNIVIFKNLTTESIHKIIDILFDEYIERIKICHNIDIVLHKSAKDLLVGEGYDEKYGARELKRTLQQLFETNMAVDILNKKYISGDSIVCCAKDGVIKFRKKSTRGTDQRR